MKNDLLKVAKKLENPQNTSIASFVNQNYLPLQLTDDLKLDRQMRHTIEVVVDRLQSGVERPRLAEALESAIRLSKGSVIISVPTDSASSAPSPPTPTASGRKRRKAIPSAADLPLEQPGFHDQLCSAEQRASGTGSGRSEQHHCRVIGNSVCR